MCVLHGILRMALLACHWLLANIGQVEVYDALRVRCYFGPGNENIGSTISGHSLSQILEYLISFGFLALAQLI